MCKDTGESPVLSAPSTLPEEDTYTVIALDIDAPFRSRNVLSPIAHWIQTDFKIQDQNQGQQSRKLESGESPVIPWLPAGPPPGAAPHRYIFLLYKQRPDKSVPAELKKKGARVMRPQRMRYDVDKIVKTLGLGEIVAVTYFVSN
jgi:phosphatidylethanolamine-binding protein (PEBP) family uncharacterized protein